MPQECLPSAGVLATFTLEELVVNIGSLPGDAGQVPLPFKVTVASAVLSVCAARTRENSHLPTRTHSCMSYDFSHEFQVPFVDLREPLSAKPSAFDALVACDVSISSCSSSSDIFITVHSITTRYHATRLPLLYQFLLSLVPPSPPSPTAPQPPPRILLKAAKVLSLWVRGGGGGTGAISDENAPPPQDAYGSHIKG